jgi:hypothetical protein
MTYTARPSFGIATAPQQVSYRDVLRVWREADTILQIGHAWLFDHLMPIGGDPNGRPAGRGDRSGGAADVRRHICPYRRGLHGMSGDTSYRPDYEARRQSGREIRQTHDNRRSAEGRAQREKLPGCPMPMRLRKRADIRSPLAYVRRHAIVRLLARASQI